LLIGGSDGGGMLLWQSGAIEQNASAFRPTAGAIFAR
jgi:hypothetical protein